MNKFIILATALLLIGGCAHKSSDNSGPSDSVFTIGGTVAGLTSDGLVLQNNGEDNLTIVANATTFTFATANASGASYAVTVMTQPTGLNCAVSNGTGMVSGANVADVTVACAPPSPVPTITISASPNPAAYLGYSVLTWSSTNADSCLLQNVNGAVLASTTSGTYTVSGQALAVDTATFTVSCNNVSGTATANVSIATTGRVELTIGTWNFFGSIYPTVLIRFWPKKNTIGYYNQTGIPVTITPSPSWMAQETPTFLPSTEDNTASWTVAWFNFSPNPADYAGTYRVQFTFEGKAFDFSLPLSPVVIPPTLFSTSITATQFADHISVSFQKIPDQYGYLSYTADVELAPNLVCGNVAAFSQGTQSPIDVYTTIQASSSCIDVSGMNFAQEPTATNVTDFITVSKTQPLPAYLMLSTGGI